MVAGLAPGGGEWADGKGPVRWGREMGNVGPWRLGWAERRLGGAAGASVVSRRPRCGGR